MILQAVFVYYGLPYFTANQVQFTNIWAVAILVVSINTGAYMAESVRGGILSIDPGQTEGAKAIGMTHFQTMLFVVFPQALRNIMPQIGNNLHHQHQGLLRPVRHRHRGAVLHRHKTAGATYWYFPSGHVHRHDRYLVLTFTCSFLLRWWEKKLDGPASYDLATTDTLAYTSGMTFPVSADEQVCGAQPRIQKGARGER
jgi:putative lysine transport system permease protein